MIRSIAIHFSRKVMLGWRLTSSSSTSWIALPVASAAWAMRRTAWPPSRVRCSPSGPVGSGENGTPRSTSQAMASALWRAMNSAVCSSTRPPPASWVSLTWEAMLSSLPSTPTMPPWAQAVAASCISRLASTITGCVSARCRATVKPARPAPTMTTGRDDSDTADISLTWASRQKESADSTPPVQVAPRQKPLTACSDRPRNSAGKNCIPTPAATTGKRSNGG